MRLMYTAIRELLLDYDRSTEDFASFSSLLESFRLYISNVGVEWYNKIRTRLLGNNRNISPTGALQPRDLDFVVLLYPAVGAILSSGL
jgi:hypothetical protein